MLSANRLVGLSLSVAAAGCLGTYQPGTPGMHTDPVPAEAAPAPSTPMPSEPTPAPAPTTPTTGGAMARQLFDQQVLPILAACAGCHAGTSPQGGPKFLGATGDAYYASLTADPRFVNNVPDKTYLITHLHAPGGGSDLTAAQGMMVVAWLSQENVERALPPPPAPANAAAIELAKFGKCMTLSDFNSSGMNDLQNQNTNQGPCTSCHQTGSYVYLSQTSTENFKRLQQSPWIMKFALPEANVDGSFKDVAPANRFADRGKEPGHPQYTLSSARLQALSKFFQLSAARYQAGTCTP